MKADGWFHVIALGFLPTLVTDAGMVAQELPQEVAAAVQSETPQATPDGNVLATAEMHPADFLDCVELRARARWRQLYRQAAAAAPPTERLRVAFTLGGLLADSHLAMQAADAQQFKNVNQDLLRYCVSLGLADKLSPLLMGESKMAESQEWDAVKPILQEKQMLIERSLHGQKDEDPAALVSLGMWFRLFEIVTEVMLADTEAKDKMLCIGSMPLLDVMAQRYASLSESVREDASIAAIGKTLGQLQRRWSAVDGQPVDELVAFTAEKVKLVNSRLTLK